MGIVDALTKFSAAQAITAAAASQSYMDLGAARNIGVGMDLYIVVSVDVAFTDGGSFTGLDVYLYGDSTTSFTPDGKQKLFTIPEDAAIGQIYKAKISPDFASNYRYIELYYDPIGASLTAGSVTAYMAVDIPAYTSYAKNYTIS